MSKFETMWINYPSTEEMKSKCVHKKGVPFENYCAIKLSECFIRSGIDIGFHGRGCWSHKGPRHAIGAEDLASHLSQKIITGFGSKIDANPKTFKSDLSDNTGIIFLKDYYLRDIDSSKGTKETFENRSGDHIDLWNKGSLTGTDMRLRRLGEILGWNGTLTDAKAVWFWEVK